MTNAQIIFQNRIFLMQEGLIKGTDEKITIQSEDGEQQIQMPEEIHTYNAWKALGYQVQKGEHAIAKFPIWKYKANKKQQDDEAGEDEQPQTGKMFKKVAFFFTIDQVKKIEGR